MTYEQGVTKVTNFALTALGLERIQSIDQEVDSASLMKEYYPIILKRLLGEYDWNFARRTLDLTEYSPQDIYKNYEYTFVLPADCVAARRVRPEQYYEIYDNDSLRCNTAVQKTVQITSADNYEVLEEHIVNYVELTYTRLCQDPMKFNPAFFQYLAYSMAIETAWMLTADTAVVNMVTQLGNSYQVIAQVEDNTISRKDGSGEKPYWARNKRDYFRNRYRDGGPNATEDFY